MTGQDPPHLVCPPRLVPRLHRDAQHLRPVLPDRGPGIPEFLQARVQQPRLGLEGGRQLNQDRPQFGPETSRRPEQPGAWPLPARLANWELARRVRRRTGLRIRDLGPMRAAGREALLGLDLADRRFGYPLEMVMNAAAAGWRVSEVQVAYLPRVGKSKVTGTVGGCVRTVRDMSQVLAR